MERQVQLLCHEITQLSKRAYNAGLFSGTSGNMSCRIPNSDIMLITPTSVRYEILTADDIVPMHLSGEVLDDAKKPSSEWKMHAAIYQHRPDVHAVFHTHSPYATAFAVTRQEIPPVLIEAHLFLGGSIRCADYASPGSYQLGERAVLALCDRGGCTLANHGVLAVGCKLEEAYLRAEYIEDLAKIYTFAKQIGEPTTLNGL